MPCYPDTKLMPPRVSCTLEPRHMSENVCASIALKLGTAHVPTKSRVQVNSGISMGEEGCHTVVTMKRCPGRILEHSAEQKKLLKSRCGMILFPES